MSPDNSSNKWKAYLWSTTHPSLSEPPSTTSAPAVDFDHIRRWVDEATGKLYRTIHRDLMDAHEVKALDDERELLASCISDSILCIKDVTHLLESLHRELAE
jgi:hypothetical protein